MSQYLVIIRSSVNTLLFLDLMIRIILQLMITFVKIMFDEWQVSWWLISRSRRKKTCSLPAPPWTRSSAWSGEGECLPCRRAGSRVRWAPRPNCVFGLPHQILQHQSQISSWDDSHWPRREQKLIWVTRSAGRRGNYLCNLQTASNAAFWRII